MLNDAIANIAKFNLAANQMAARNCDIETYVNIDGFIVEMRSRYAQIGNDFDGDGFKGRVFERCRTSTLTLSEAFEEVAREEKKRLYKLLI